MKEALNASRERGETAVIIAWDAQAKAVLSVADQPKPTSPDFSLLFLQL